MKTIRVLLADDHVLVRAGIRSLLEKLTAIQVVAEVGNARDALDLVEQHHPDVLVMDLAMPELNGLEGTARVARKHPAVRVLVLSMHTDAEHVVQALRAGAAGYLVKDAVPAELELAVRAVAAGETYLSPAVARHALAGSSHGGDQSATLLTRLTPRLREVLQLLAEGRSTTEIGLLLHISPKTVENHRTRLMHRLGVRDLPGLVRYAIQFGMIEARP